MERRDQTFAFDATLGLTCDGIPLAEIAARVGTPTYVYSAASIRGAWTRLDSAFASVPHAVHYALKANSTRAILRLLRALGSGGDANSVGEIEVALCAGFGPEDLVFTGVGKRQDELRRAVELGVKTINVESAGELERIDELATARGVRARVAIRLNPDIDAGSHPHISTGRRLNKFGVPIDRARQLYREAAARPGLRPVGVHIHIGSQITDLNPLERAAEALVALALELRADGIGIEHVDVGGGLGIPYDGSSTPTVDEYANALLPIVKDTGFTVLLEPGRVIVGPSAVLLARVIDVKSNDGDKPFVVLDAGMTELLRPALYGAYHRIEPVQPRPGEPALCEVVGPLCESSDTVGKDRMLPPLEVGDLVAVLDAGAYGSAMSFTYNRRPLPCEVMVDHGQWDVIRRRQTIEDMTALEV
ncbi:MAG TPA: diaminopimelate decarboxylase [Vicinamibacterales bacterium]|jgi:diaminopimelate decarboxylase